MTSVYTDGFLMLRIRPVFVLVFLGSLVACGGHSSPGGPTPSTPAPQISCPTDQTVRSVAAPTQPVTYDVPAVTGGTAPVQTSCNPASGSNFPLGSTTVTCTASDAS